MCVCAGGGGGGGGGRGEMDSLKGRLCPSSPGASNLLFSSRVTYWSPCSYMKEIYLELDSYKILGLERVYIVGPWGLSRFQKPMQRRACIHGS